MPRTRRELKTFPINVRELEVRDVVDLSPGMRRLTLVGEQLGAFTTADGIEVPELRNEGFDDHVKVIVPGPGQDSPVPPLQVEGHLDWAPPQGRPTAKDYTPRRYDPVRGELDLDFVRHGTGFASTWVGRVQPGDRAYIAGPKSSSMLPTDVDWMLVAGDETALPAIGRLLEELPDGMRAQVFVEVESAAHQIALAPRAGVEITWLSRDGAPAGRSDLLEQAVRGAAWWPGEVYAWVAGETLTIKPIRNYLKHERQVPRDCVEVVGYWRRTEVEASPEGLPAVDCDGAALQQLLAMADLTRPSALRAAVTTRLIQRLDRGPATVGTLVGELGLAEVPLRALLRYLRALEVLAPDAADAALTGPDPKVELAALGSELAGDELLLAELDLDGAHGFLELPPTDLVALLKTGRPVARADGRSAADVLRSGDRLAVAHRAARGDEAVWSAPSVALHHDWSGYREITLLGAGAPEVAATLLRENPALRVRLVDLPSVLEPARALLSGPQLRDRAELVASSPYAPPPGPVGDAVVLVHLLDQLPDSDASHVLRGMVEAMGDADLVVAETVLDPTEAVHDHDAERDLKLLAAFGSGLRTAARIAELLADAGVDCDAPRDLGWDMQLWVARGRAV